MMDLLKNVEKDPHFYEAVVIVHANWTDEDIKDFCAKAQAIIESADGKIAHMESWGKRSLATPINKIKTGHYLYFLYSAKVGAVKEWERIMKMNEKVLRFLHTRLDESVSLDKHLETFHELLEEAHKRQAKQDAIRAQRRKPNFNR